MKDWDAILHICTVSKMKINEDVTPDNSGNGMMLPLVEDFYTVQGEGRNSGKAAYFIRLAGCDVRCRWCDAGSTWNAQAFTSVPVENITARASASGARMAVITGGEPLIHPLGPITGCLGGAGMEVCLETSGTHPLTGNFDWICLSPKRHFPPLDDAFMAAGELKVVIGGRDDLIWAEECAGRVRDECLLYLQPEWSVYDRVIGDIVDYVKSHPRWLVSLQTHKFMNIP